MNGIEARGAPEARSRNRSGSTAAAPPPTRAGQLTASAVHVTASNRTGCVIRVPFSLVLMLTMAEVLHPGSALAAAIGGGDRPDGLERHDEKEQEKDENPPTHCGGVYVIAPTGGLNVPQSGSREGDLRRQARAHARALLPSFAAAASASSCLPAANRLCVAGAHRPTKLRICHLAVRQR